MKYLTTNWLFFVLVSSGLNSLGFGQFDQVINVPPEELADQQIIPSNTQVNVFDGGIVGIGVFAGQFGVANENVEFNIFGGTIGSSFRAFDGSEVNIFGGEIGSFFEASAGSVVNIEGGELSSFSADADVFNETGSIVNVSGGTFTASFSARIFSNVNISGGNFSRGLFVGANSFPDVLPPANVTVSGGVFGDIVFVGETGALTIAGGEFRLNGQDITGEKTLALGESDVLTLTLTGGNPMLLSPLDGDQFFSDLILVESDVPPIDNTEFFIDESSTMIPTGLRQGQSLELSGNGTLPENFTATQATLRIKDGEVGFNLDVIDGSLFLDGGELDSPTNVFGNSVVELNGGDTGFRLTVFNGANLNVNDGHANCLVGMDGSFISVSGGQGTLIEANAGCEVSVDGGIFGYRFESASRGEIFGGVLRFLTVRENSDVTLSGGEFLVNGKKPNRLSSVTLKPGDVLTGTLVDGTPFISSGIIESLALAETQIPPNNLENFIVDQPDDLVPPGLRAGQTLQLFDGGELPSFFTAVGAALRVNGGTVGNNLSVADSTVDISSGSIGLGLTGFQGATVNVSGGQLIFLASARAGSEFNICGGQLGGGGTFIFDVESGAVVNFSGGQLGTGYQANSGSETHFAGTEFFIDGVAVDGLELGEPVAISEREVTLSGRLQDGSEFSFDLNPIEGSFLDDFFSPDATVTITLVESLIRGDFNGDEVVNLLDVALFVDAIASGVFVPQADINKDGIVDLLDIPLFVELLVGA